MKIVFLFFRLIAYAVIFLKELIIANFQITKIVLSPGLNFKSAAINYKSLMSNKAELILITNSITLTPGTLVMDADLKSKEILVHVMATESDTDIMKEINRFPESKALWALRGKS